MVDERVLALAACVGLLILLRIIRHRRLAPLRAASEMLHTADALWHHATAIPPAHLTTPLRRAVAGALKQYAAALDTGPLRYHTPVLYARSHRVLSLPKRNPLQRRAASISEHCKAIAELLVQAHKHGQLDGQALEEAQMAATLSAEMADIDALSGKAQRAAKLRLFQQADVYRSAALDCCDRLPPQAAERVRRVVTSKLAY